MFRNGFCILRLQCRKSITTRSFGPIAVRIMIWATVHMVAAGHGIWDIYRQYIIYSHLLQTALIHCMMRLACYNILYSLYMDPDVTA